MASTFSVTYGTSNQSVTTAFGSLGNGSAKSSAQVAFDGLTAADLEPQAKFKSGASGTSATGYVDLWISGSADGGTTYGDGAAASSSVTLKGNIGPKLLRIAVVANATTYQVSCAAIAALFNGVPPAKLIFVADNHAGSALDTTDGNHGIWYQAVTGNSS